MFHTFRNHFQLPVECLHDLYHCVTNQDNCTSFDDIVSATVNHRHKCTFEAWNFVFWQFHNKERLSYLEAKVAELLYTHKYTVSFNVNGGAESYADQTIEEGKKASKPIDPTRDGYVFLGWYAGDELWSFAGHTVTENIALTAKWDTVAVYQLAYDKTHYIVTGLKYDDIENVSILDKYNDLPVLTIKDEAFKDCVNMKSIIVPNTITSIGSAAFNGCYSLEQMEIPFAGATARESGLEESDLFGYIFGNTSYEGSTLIKQKPDTLNQPTYEFYLPNSLESVIINGTIIGNYDFNYCSTIKNVIIKGSVTNIGNCAFLYTGITNIIIPDSVTRIGGSAFSYCDDLKYVIMPDSVTTINSSAFGSNNKLTVYCEAASVQDGWVTGTYYTWVNSSIPVIYRTTGYGTTDGFIWVEANNEVILADYIGKDTSIEIPTKINGTPITTIARYAFDGCATLSSITMSNNIISIGEYAFQNVQNITNIVVPDSVKSIGIGAFKGCNKIENITLPFVGASADARNYNAVFGYIFGYTQVQAAYESGDPSNAYDNLNYGKAPSETIWQYSYKGVYSSYNEHRNYPTSVYYYIPTSIKNVTITTQTTLPVAAFNNCSFIETINLPMTMTKIGSYAFQKCTQLKHINIPIPVTSIDSYAFSGCSNLNAVYYGGTSSNWSGISISSNNSPLTSATCYYYSESQPTDEGNYWYYDKNKNIVVW